MMLKKMVVATLFVLVAGAVSAQTIWELEAVDASGNATHPLVGAAAPNTENLVVVEGIALNNTAELLNPAMMWQTYVQAESPEQGGIAAWAGSFFGGDWPRYPGDIQPGDRIRITGYMENHNGKANITHRHSAEPSLQFEVTVLERGVGMPEPHQIPSIAACDFFDASREGGGEFYQGQWVELSGLSLVSGDWAAGQTVQVTDASGHQLDLLLAGPGDFSTPPGPGRTFTARGIFDQEDETAPYTGNYRLWVKSQADVDFDTAADGHWTLLE